MRAHHESYDVIINSSVSVYFFNALKATLSLQDDAIIKEGVNVDERKDHECSVKTVEPGGPSKENY